MNAAELGTTTELINLEIDSAKKKHRYAVHEDSNGSLESRQNIGISLDTSGNVDLGFNGSSSRVQLNHCQPQPLIAK